MVNGLLEVSLPSHVKSKCRGSSTCLGSRIPGHWSTRWVGGQVGVVVVLFGCSVSTSDEVHLAFFPGLMLVLRPKCYNGSCQLNHLTIKRGTINHLCELLCVLLCELLVWAKALQALHAFESVRCLDCWLCRYTILKVEYNCAPSHLHISFTPVY